MATIIDTLILSLKLDPSGLTEGQRESAEALRRIETASLRSGKNIEDNVGKGFVSFFKGLEQPFQAVRRQFEQLATTTSSTSPAQQNLTALSTQARRTGESVESGALAGASGLRILGLAGVAAISTIALLGKGIEGLSGIARGVFPQGIGAQAAGLPVSGFTAVSQALFRGQNVPQEDTQNFLEGLGQLFAGYKAGIPSAIHEFAQLQIPAGLAGVPLNPNATPEETLQSFAVAFAKLAPDQRIALGAQLGMSPTLAAGLGNAGTGLSGEIASAQRTAVTDQDVLAAQNLIDAQNKLSTSWQKLSRDIALDLDPALTKVFNILDRIASVVKPSTIEHAGLAALDALFPGSVLLFDALGSGGSTTPAPVSPSTTAPIGNISPSTMAALDVISQHEDQGRDVLNYRYDRTHTASGYYQLTDTNWREYGKGLVDFTQYPQAKGSPKALQTAVAARLYEAQGVKPWVTSSGGSIGSVPQFNAEVAAEQARMVRVAQSASGPPGAVSNNNVTIGDVNVHGVDTNNAPAVGAAVHDKLASQMDVLYSNTGLQ